ncbi:MAG: hypothetical protein ACYDCQ_03010 [Dehalococcoidia bacterium]
MDGRHRYQQQREDLMRSVKTLCLLAFTLLALGIVGVASASAATLPSSLYLAGESGSRTLTATSTTAKSEFSGIRNLVSKGYKFVFKAKEQMEELGEAELEFTNVKLGETSCNTEGDASGVVLINKPEYHNVPMSGGNWGTLVLLSTATSIKCGSLTIKVRGSQLSKSITALGKESTTFEGETGKCGGTNNRTPGFEAYETDTGTAKAKLESSVGLGFEQSCEQVEGTVSSTINTGMMEVMN